jgi:hypothetical protein
VARPLVVFCTLAENQTRFYADLAASLADRSFDVGLVSFHEPSLARVRARGLEAVSGFDACPPVAGDPRPVFRRFGIADPALAVGHEKLFYDLRDTPALLARLAGALEGMDAVLRRFRDRAAPGARVALVQELGGFVSVLGGFHAARKLGIDHVFIEPSFFRGKVFFAANSFRAPRIPADGGSAAGEEALRTLADTVQAKRLVIPEKDRGAYRGNLAKVLSARNLRRLAEKAFQKYVLGQREEFSHLGGHVGRHLRMARNELAFRRLYRKPPARDPLVYYPLHVPADVQLTVRAPDYLDQFALLDALARALPPGHRLAFKEHPARIGASPLSRVRELLRRHDRIDFLDPATNNYDALRRADVVVTVNSKSGAEALLLGKPVLALGDSFYRDSGLVRPLRSLDELPRALAEAVRGSFRPDPDAVRRFFGRVWDRSFPGELYSEEPGQAKLFAESLDRYLREGRFLQEAGAEDP